MLCSTVVRLGQGAPPLSCHTVSLGINKMLHAPGLPETRCVCPAQGSCRQSRPACARSSCLSANPRLHAGVRQASGGPARGQLGGPGLGCKPPSCSIGKAARAPHRGTAHAVRRFTHTGGFAVKSTVQEGHPCDHLTWWSPCFDVKMLSHHLVASSSAAALCACAPRAFGGTCCRAVCTSPSMHQVCTWVLAWSHKGHIRKALEELPCLNRPRKILLNRQSACLQLRLPCPGSWLAGGGACTWIASLI